MFAMERRMSDRRGRDIRRPACEAVWPRRPFESRRGRCVAAQFAEDGIYIAVQQRGRALAWLPREAVMTEDELQVWLRGGRPAARPGIDGRLK